MNGDAADDARPSHERSCLTNRQDLRVFSRTPSLGARMQASARTAVYTRMRVCVPSDPVLWPERLIGTGLELPILGPRPDS